MRHLHEVAITVFLIVISMFFIGNISKEAARRAQCQSNLKELFRAEQQYEETYGVVPPLYIAQRPQWIFWHHFIAPMVKDVRNFACPSDPRMYYLYEKKSPLFGGIVALTSCYGMNRFILEVGAKKAKAPEFKLKYLKTTNN